MNDSGQSSPIHNGHIIQSCAKALQETITTYPSSRSHESRRDSPVLSGAVSPHSAPKMVQCQNWKVPKLKVTQSCQGSTETCCFPTRQSQCLGTETRCLRHCFIHQGQNCMTGYHQVLETFKLIAWLLYVECAEKTVIIFFQLIKRTVTLWNIYREFLERIGLEKQLVTVYIRIVIYYLPYQKQYAYWYYF